jgi:hypothetical protein
MPWKAYWLFLYSGKLALAAMYLRRVRVAGRRFAAALTPAYAAQNLGMALDAFSPNRSAYITSTTERVV